MKILFNILGPCFLLFIFHANIPKKLIEQIKCHNTQRHAVYLYISITIYKSLDIRNTSKPCFTLQGVHCPPIILNLLNVMLVVENINNINERKMKFYSRSLLSLNVGRIWISRQHRHLLDTFKIKHRSELNISDYRCIVLSSCVIILMCTCLCALLFLSLRSALEKKHILSCFHLFKVLCESSLVKCLMYNG